MARCILERNVLFRTANEGHSWDAISPDLTIGDPETLQPSGGPLTKDNTGAETYATIFAVAESPVEAGVIWTGSDDGLVHVSRDGGADVDERQSSRTTRLGADQHYRGITAPSGQSLSSPRRATRATTTGRICS